MITHETKQFGSHPDFPDSFVAFDPDLGLYRTIPYPTEAALAKFYTQEYREIRQESPDEAYLKFMRHRAMEQSRFIMEASSRRNFDSVMDIGCGCGELLNALQPHSSRLIGFETDTVMAAHAIANRSANSIDIRNEHYSPAKHSLECDLITMSHVLEHIPEPVEFLSMLGRETLKTGGFLFLEVPNEPNFWVDEQVRRGTKGLGHLNYFTRSSLEDLLKKAGFVNPISRECGKSVRKHMLNTQPPGSLWQRALRRLRRIIPKHPSLPDYKPEGGSEPRIYLQVIASKPIK
jgi:2-polyprenyl-3-methyl-5-hydroxy-6-metoxy-1,4-benzoquinol methylase